MSGWVEGGMAVEVAGVVGGVVEWLEVVSAVVGGGWRREGEEWRVVGEGWWMEGGRWRGGS